MRASSDKAKRWKINFDYDEAGVTAKSLEGPKTKGPIMVVELAYAQKLELEIKALKETLSKLTTKEI